MSRGSPLIDVIICNVPLDQLHIQDEALPRDSSKSELVMRGAVRHSGHPRQ
jgi:hypothetical protein